jgi:hypothetical protein
MAGCGYVCPQCEGRGFTDDVNPCDWCANPTVSTPTTNQTTITNEQWLKEVHEGKCCADE